MCTKSLNLHLVVWQWHGTRGVDPFTGLGVGGGGGGQKLEKMSKFSAQICNIKFCVRSAPQNLKWCMFSSIFC